MASSEKRTDSMSALLECPICLEPFSDPRMLTTCFHTLCYKCLGDHIAHFGQNGHFECPECRASLQIPEDGADGFSKNFFVNRCMAVVTNTKTGSRSKTVVAEDAQDVNQEKSCQNFEDLQCEQAVCFCLECCEFYCKVCWKIHSKSRLSKDHQRVALDELTDEMLANALAQSALPRCAEHKAEWVKMYCKTCNCATCPMCISIGHQTHKIQELSKFDEDLKSQLGEVLTALQDLVGTDKDKATQISKSLKKVETNTNTARETAKMFFGKLQKMLDEKAEQIDQNFSKTSEDAKTEAALQTKDLDQHTELLESLQSFVDDLMKTGTVYNRLASLPVVRNRLEELQTKSKSSELPEDALTGTVDLPNVADLVMEHMNSLEFVQEQEAIPSLTAGQILEIKLKCTCATTHKAVDQKTAKCKTTTSKSSKTLKLTSPTGKSPKQKLTVIVYVSGWYVNNPIDVAVHSLRDEIDCDVIKSASKQLRPVTADEPRVDIIYCWDDGIHSVKDFELDVETAGGRHLVLVHDAPKGSTETTRQNLGDKASLFKRVVQFDTLVDSSYAAASEILANYFRRVWNQY